MYWRQMDPAILEVPKMAGQNMVVGLDIGTTKVVVLVGEVDDHGGVSVIGVGEQESQGLRKGIIVDLESVVRSISQALEKAEQMCGCRLQSAYLGVSGPHLSSVNNKGVVAITNREREITYDDVERVLQAAKVVALSQDKKIIHIHPRQFAVDGNDGIVDPVGMAGTRLEAQINIITASATALQNLLRCVQRAQLEEEELLPMALASAEAVLLPAEKELGCLLVDIGGGTTEFALFDQGRLWYTSVLPVGGSLITSDLAIGLRIPVEVAEQVKINHGCVFSKLQSDNETISVPDMLGRETKQVSKRMLSAIIEPRVQEICSLVRNELKISGYRGILPGGIIITGGTAELDGLIEFTSCEMDLPVRIGRPDKFNGVSEVTDNPAYAAAIGLMLYGARSLATQQAAPAAEHLFGEVCYKVKKIFKDFFA